MVINKKASKIEKFEVHFVLMVFVEVLFVGKDFVSSIISSHITTEFVNNTSYMFNIFVTTCSRIPNIIFSHT